MTRTTNRLSARTVSTLKKPGRHADGGGLYLSISPDGSRRRWVYLFRWRERGQTGAGKLREMGLGSASTVSLARARDLATTARTQVANGVNPLAVRDMEPEKRVPTFGEMGEEVITSLETGWKNPKHRDQWRMTLTRYCEPIGSVPVDQVTTEQVLAILKPLWTKVPETASRLRGRIEKVLDAARAKRHRTAENPARWRGHLDHLLPRRQKLTRGHHKALPYREVPAFIARLHQSGSMSALCLEFAILTAARSGEAMGAQWREIDLDRGVWTVPKERMKAGREHRVPLSDRAREILVELHEARQGEFVFPGSKPGRPLSTMALEMLLRRLEADATVHGFRSAFRDWAAEQTSTPREVAEAALAHTNKDKIEAAYFRTDLFDKRRTLMNQWASFCAQSAITVPIAAELV